MPSSKPNWKNYATAEANNGRVLSQTENSGKSRFREDDMEKMFCLGIMLGALGGALLVANSYKMRSFVKKSQADFVEKVNEMIDEKLECKEGSEKSEPEKKEKKK